MAHHTSFNDLNLWNENAGSPTEHKSHPIRQIPSRLFDLILSGWKGELLPTGNEDYDRSYNSLADNLQDQGLGLSETVRHLLQDVVPGLNAMSLSPNYYGFI